jgi:hypothetical protein
MTKLASRLAHARLPECFGALRTASIARVLLTALAMATAATAMALTAKTVVRVLQPSL